MKNLDNKYSTDCRIYIYFVFFCLIYWVTLFPLYLIGIGVGDSATLVSTLFIPILAMILLRGSLKHILIRFTILAIFWCLFLVVNHEIIMFLKCEFEINCDRIYRVRVGTFFSQLFMHISAFLAVIVLVLKLGFQIFQSKSKKI